MNKNIPEILLIDKPKGITSYDVIRTLKRKFNLPKGFKIGHGGTLDPMATGLLLIGVGVGTKKLKDILGLSKTYESEIILGIKTDTGDAEGRILDKKKVQIKNGKDLEINIEKIVNEMVGILPLPVPAYSAIKRGGEALYKKARRGEKVETPVKDMKVYKAVFDGVRKEGDFIIIKVFWEVGSGTYIRSLAEDLGRRLDLPASLYSLRRTKVGTYDISESLKL